MSEFNFRRAKFYQLQGFEITLAKDTKDPERLYVVAMRGEEVLYLFNEPARIAIEYVQECKRR